MMTEEHALRESFRRPLGVIPLKSTDAEEIILYEGYVKAWVSVPTSKHRVQYTISISAEKIEPVVKAYVTSVLPKNLFGILEVTRNDSASEPGVKEEYLSPFQDKENFMATIEPYLFRLIHDGTIGFGVASYTQHEHEELFLERRKTMIIRTSKTSEVEAVLGNAGIEPFGDRPPVFLDAYPTSSGDLFSFADAYPKDYAQYGNKRYHSPVYTKELIRLLNFKEN